MRKTMMLLPWLALAACAQTPPPQAGAPVDHCHPNAASLESRAGKQWLAANGWRYASPAEAEAAYGRLITGMSPWADWVAPVDETLAPGTRFQMAMAPGQPSDRPGAFGTFDRIEHVSDVRRYLAVRSDWKPRVERVVVFEVTQPLPVAAGPIGPQVDPGQCRLLAGRWSQFQMKVPPAERMRYLRILSEHPIH